MDKIEKLFRKLSAKDVSRLRETIILITRGKIENLDVKKIQSTSYYRVRVGKFRIKFKYNKIQRKFEIIEIDRRSERTYR